MLHVEGGQWLVQTDGGMSDQGIEQTQVVAQMVGGIILQGPLAVGGGGPVQGMRLAELLDAHLLRLVQTALKEFQ